MERRHQQVLKGIGERIREIRKAKGLSQLDLEVECGINRTEISRIENGTKNIEVITLIKLADAMQVSLKSLLD